MMKNGIPFLQKTRYNDDIYSNNLVRVKSQKYKEIGGLS